MIIDVAINIGKCFMCKFSYLFIEYQWQSCATGVSDVYITGNYDVPQ